MWTTLNGYEKKENMAGMWKKLMKKRWFWRTDYAKNVTWSYVLEGHARKCVEQHCELDSEQLCKVSSHCLDWSSIQAQEELRSVGELPRSLHHNLSGKRLFLARNGRLDILWSVHKFLALLLNGFRCATHDTQDLFLIFITTSENPRQHCQCEETLPNNADLDCFKTPILQEILKTRSQHQVEHCVFWEVARLFQPVGFVRNKLQYRTVPTGSEIIS